jgi:hypothetical protein
MIDPAGGGRSSGQAAAAAEAARRAAEEAARRAAEEAARRAAEERARAAAAERLRDQNLARVATGPFGAQPPGVGSASTPATPTWPATEATGAAQVHVPVPVRPDVGVAALVDDWVREGKSAIGMGSTEVYDAYVGRNAWASSRWRASFRPPRLLPRTVLLEAGDTEGYVNQLVQPSLQAMSISTPTRASSSSPSSRARSARPCPVPSRSTRRRRSSA